MIERLYKIVDAIYNRYSLRKYHVIYGRDLIIRGRILIMGNISIGNAVSINSGMKYNPIGGQDCTSLITHEKGRIMIGNNVGISNCALVSRERIEIQDDVRIGGSCKIYDNDFHSIEFDHRMEKPDSHINSAPVLIRRGAFVGAHTIILKGVTIGRNAVIGAGSVVTKSVPDEEIWAGNPAKYVKHINANQNLCGR